MVENTYKVIESQTKQVHSKQGKNGYGNELTKYVIGAQVLAGRVAQVLVMAKKETCKVMEKVGLETYEFVVMVFVTYC